jgi:hypothetical protein
MSVRHTLTGVLFKSSTGACGDLPIRRTSNSMVGIEAVQRTQHHLTHYQSGGRIRVRVDLTANHGGKFGFSICQRTGNLDQACFNQHLTRTDIPGERWFWIQTPPGECPDQDVTRNAWIRADMFQSAREGLLMKY